MKSFALMFAGGLLLYVVLSGKTEVMWQALLRLPLPVSSQQSAPVAPAQPAPGALP